MNSPTNETPQYEEIYETIKDHKEEQFKEYQNFLSKLSPSQLKNIYDNCADMQLDLDLSTGTLNYLPNFKPLDLHYDICYVRHGKTEGNTEPRVFQGQVDSPQNQLNRLGIEQAQEAAQKLEDFINDQDWTPDFIILSPLQRAIDTGRHFFDNHKTIPLTMYRETAEMSFGSWDNQYVKDIEPTSMAHLFYLYQNAVVRAPGPYIVEDNVRADGILVPGRSVPAENFIDVLMRLKLFLLSLQSHDLITSCLEQNRRARVVMYGHSMVGAAVSILLGHGTRVRNNDNQRAYFCFDGKHIMKHATPTLLLPKMPAPCL